MAYSLEKAAEAAHLGFFRQEAPKAIEESLEGVDRNRQYSKRNALFLSSWQRNKRAG